MRWNAWEALEAEALTEQAAGQSPQGQTGTVKTNESVSLQSWQRNMKNFMHWEEVWFYSKCSGKPPRKLV